jgi:FlaG/FlaF family flagellin (archaellin)
MVQIRSHWLAPVLIAVLLAGAPAAYVCGYFTMAEAVHHWPDNPWTVRVYPWKWQAVLFTPAAALESVIRGRQVSVVVKSGIEV